MKILGIDPGIGIVGYSLIEFDGKTPVLTHSGSIQTSKNKSEPARLLEIWEDINTIIEKYKPDCSAIEKLFFFRNAVCGAIFALSALTDTCLMYFLSGKFNF